MDETNLLTLVSPWLDNIYQIQTKLIHDSIIFIIYKRKCHYSYFAKKIESKQGQSPKEEAILDLHAVHAFVRV